MCYLSVRNLSFFLFIVNTLCCTSLCDWISYKFWPFRITEVQPAQGDSSSSYRIMFPSNILPIFANLRDLQPLQLETESTMSGKSLAHTPEDANRQMHALRFVPGPSFSLTDLCQQFYLSHANAYNFDRWYPSLCQLHIYYPDGSHAPVVEPVSLVPLSDDHLASILRLQEAYRGQYPSHATSELLQLATALQTHCDEFIRSLRSQPCHDSSAAAQADAVVRELKVNDVTLSSAIPSPRPSPAAPAEQTMPDTADSLDAQASPVFFFKLSTRSAKDSRFYNDQRVFRQINKSASLLLQKCQARSMVHVVSALVRSERAAADCASHLAWRVLNKPPLCLVLQKWLPFVPRYEFRCWVFEGQLNAICPVCYPNHYPEFDNPVLVERIKRAALLLVNQSHALLPFESYVVDLIYSPETGHARVCEYNPWGPYSSTDSNLFSWELDHEVLYRAPLNSLDRTALPTAAEEVDPVSPARLEAVEFRG
jgi:hypothetical protein